MSKMEGTGKRVSNVYNVLKSTDIGNYNPT